MNELLTGLTDKPNVWNDKDYDLCLEDTLEKIHE